MKVLLYFGRIASKVGLFSRLSAPVKGSWGIEGAATTVDVCQPHPTLEWNPRSLHHMNTSFYDSIKGLCTQKYALYLHLRNKTHSPFYTLFFFEK